MLDNQEIKEENTYLVFINPLGIDSYDRYIYEFLFSEEPENVWGPDWHVSPAKLSNNLLPEPTTYSIKRILKTTINLRTAQKSSCFSMQDCIDGIVALGYEDISKLEEYPEDRVVFNFGEKYIDTENKLAKRNQLFEDF